MILLLLVASCVEGSVRLVVGDLADYYDTVDLGDYYFDKDELLRGRVEICIGGRYGTICDDFWDNRDASVVCTQLAFSPYGKTANRTILFHPLY